MRSYVYENVKLSNGQRIVTRYTPGEALFMSIVKFFGFLFIVWPFQLFIWWPMKFIFKGILILLELSLRGIWWLIKLPFCLLFARRTPKF